MFNKLPSELGGLDVEFPVKQGYGGAFKGTKERAENSVLDYVKFINEGSGGAG